MEAARAQLQRALIDYVPRVSLGASYTRYESVQATTLGTAVFAPGAASGPVASDQQLVAAPIAIRMLDNATALNVGTAGG